MIVVFGSVNVDFVTRVAALPAPGETVSGPSYAVMGGGKGANQAWAAALGGARTVFVGAVGRDPFADMALADLVAAGVDVSAVTRTDAPTGAAFITVDEAGENMIAVASGANLHADPASLLGLGLGPGDTLLLQGELSAAASASAAAHAKAAGARVVFNAAPVSGFDASCLSDIDILVVNASEALAVALLLGTPEPDPDAAARAIDAAGTACVVTLGGEGVIGWWSGVRRKVEAFPISVVDTIGAGDAFCGGFAAALDRGYGFSGALLRGAAAGAAACTGPGARGGSPDRASVERLVGATAL